MPSNNDDYPAWFLWLWEKGFWWLLGGGLLFLIAMIVLAAMLDSRLEALENQLYTVPPRSYEPPALTDYAADGVEPEDLPVRQWMYVPSYSHIYFAGGSPYSLETTLSIRNVDIDQPIYIGSVQYFDTNGELVKTFVDRLIEIKKLQTIEFLVERRDSSGGSGANFLVEWLSANGVNKPVVKAVMVGTSGTQGISFSETGIEVSAPDRQSE